MRKAVQLDPGSVLARIQLGMALHRSQQPTEARRVFADAEAAFPDSPDVLNYHGELLVEAQEMEAAKAKFSGALSISGNKFALAHVNLGVLELHRKQDLEATEPPAPPRPAPPRPARSRGRGGGGGLLAPPPRASLPRLRPARAQAAIKHCEKAISVDPLCETAHVHMAHLCLQKYDLRGAVAAYDRAVEMLRLKQATDGPSPGLPAAWPLRPPLAHPLPRRRLLTPARPAAAPGAGRLLLDARGDRSAARAHRLAARDLRATPRRASPARGDGGGWDGLRPRATEGPSALLAAGRIGRMEPRMLGCRVHISESVYGAPRGESPSSSRGNTQITKQVTGVRSQDTSPFLTNTKKENRLRASECYPAENYGLRVYR